MTDLTCIKKEIIFHGTRRGLRELDIILGEFVQRFLDDLSDADLQDLRDLLRQHEPDLLVWFVDEQTPPESVNTPIFQRILKFKHERLFL